MKRNEERLVEIGGEKVSRTFYNLIKKNGFNRPNQYRGLRNANKKKVLAHLRLKRKARKQLQTK